jgi:hypothetical protein
VTLASGQPYSPILSPLTDINVDGNNRNDRAPGFARNSFNYPVFFSIDPRITKDVPIGPVTLQVILEAFNVFNRSNVVGVNQGYYGVNGTVLTPLASFGAPTTSAGPRILQLAAKVIF